MEASRKPSKTRRSRSLKSVGRNGQLQLELVDVHGNRLNGDVDVVLRHQQLSDHRVLRGLPASKKILIKDLHGAPQGLYRIEVDPPAYLPISQFVNLKASGITDLRLAFPIDSRKIQKIQFPVFQGLIEALRELLKRSDAVLSFEGKTGADLFTVLDDVRRAGLLNIAAKAQSTLLSNGKPVLAYVNRVIELRGDRFFAAVSKELREETKNSVGAGLFRPVDGSLHHPPEGYSQAGSFKTEDRYGNLQLTFFMDGDDCVADVDIDDAAGLEHVFQVLRNSITDRPTNPFDIHQILVFHQKLDPGYRFVV
jgi:hypothetical protein